MDTGFTTDTHDVLKAVETGAPRVINRLAVFYIGTHMTRFNLHMTFWAPMRACAILPLTLIGTINNEASFPSRSPSNWNFLMCTTRFPAAKIVYALVRLINS